MLELFYPHRVTSNKILRDAQGRSRGVGFARMESRFEAIAAIRARKYSIVILLLNSCFVLIYFLFLLYSAWKKNFKFPATSSQVCGFGSSETI
jgi:hypothetical protein